MIVKDFILYWLSFRASLQGGAKNGANGTSYLIANILKTP